MAEVLRRQTIHHELPENHGINLTPLIDVIFQLLIFFMLASTLIKPNMIELDLPESTSGVKNQEPDLIAVTYRRLGDKAEITLNRDALDNLGALAEGLRKLRRPGDEAMHRVDIQIDREVSYQDVIAVIDTVRDAGFPRFSLQTLMPSTRRQADP